MEYKENDQLRVIWGCCCGREKHSFTGIVKPRKNKLMLHNEKADFWLDLSSKFLETAEFIHL